MRIILALALTALLAAACGSGGTVGSTAEHGGMNRSPMAGSSASPTPGKEDRNYDRRFIAGMTPHHESAIEMAEVALERAEHLEIRELAEDIIEAQRSENERMAGWLEAWYGSETPEMPGMDHSMPGMETEGAMGVTAEELRKAEPFDKAFIDAMIPHHEAAIQMARDAREKAEHPELRELAGRIVGAQQREIDRMREWRSQWYGS